MVEERNLPPTPEPPGPFVPPPWPPMNAPPIQPKRPKPAIGTSQYDWGPKFIETVGRY